MSNGHTNMFKRWLHAANAYYHYSEDEGTTMTDAEWDSIGRELTEEWDNFDHPLKAKFEEDGVPRLHTACHLTAEDYKNV